MNWVAFWVALVVVPLACGFVGYLPMIIVRALMWWDSRSISFRRKIHTAGEALGKAFAAVLVVAVAALVGYTWDHFQ